MKSRTLRLLGAAQLALAFAIGPSPVSAAAVPPRDSQALDRLGSDSGGSATISLDRVTGAARFVRLVPGQLRIEGTSAEDVARNFFSSYGGVFGIQNHGEELRTIATTSDRLQTTHVSFQQLYRGVPVFAGILKAHVDSRQRLMAVNGTFVPGINVDTSPLLNEEKASERAVAAVKNQGTQGAATPLTAKSSSLYVYRTGLARGVSGQDHLVYEVEVGNGSNVRELVYVDARDGKIVDKISGIYESQAGRPANANVATATAASERSQDAVNLPDALSRKVWNVDIGNELLWEEGDPFPTGDEDVDNIIPLDLDTYKLYSNMTNGTYISYDNQDSPFESAIIGPFGACPNAFADGQYTHYCRGVTGGDVVAHEWTHNYTAFTHGLIYAWQPGALNESYSDIFGNTVQHFFDPQLPDAPRHEGKCSIYSINSGSMDRLVRVTQPSSIADDYAALKGAFGGDAPDEGLPGDYALVEDADGNHFGCTLPFVNDVRGKIALIDRGGVPERCEFGLKALNAEQSGAIATVIINDSGDNLIVMGAGAVGDQVTIPAVMIGQSNGELIKAAFPQRVAGSLIKLPPDPRYKTDSKRWLIGEDSPAFGGAIRDMFDPTCHANPGQVSDTLHYQCGDADNGGVHNNSGVPNHAYALLVDGGVFNGQSVRALGYNKTAAIYWRAMSVYQVPTTKFADHADALEQSCDDLIGAKLYDLHSGKVSGDVIDSGNCKDVTRAMLAVEMRSDPPCVFEPLLEKDPPALCDGGPVTTLAFEDFDDINGWRVSNKGTNPEWITRDWEVVSTLPGGRSGSGAYATDSLGEGNCTPGDDQSGLIFLDTPRIKIPQGAGPLHVAFEHYVATEATADGGLLKVSRNGGKWRDLGPEAFTFNPYNSVMAAGPLVGQSAFTGSDGGEVTGSWGESQLDLPDVFQPGDRVQLRFAFGVDGCGWLDGWYLDDFRVYTCSAPVSPGNKLATSPRTGAAPASRGASVDR